VGIIGSTSVEEYRKKTLKLSDCFTFRLSSCSFLIYTVCLRKKTSKVC